MGNYNLGAVKFQQCANDFPCAVELGKKFPSWSLRRWKSDRGLRFIPPYDEGFTARGDSRRLVYKGRGRSHRFTILGDEAFEYDCVLEREPESNVISLLMEGAENFDFFRQPDFTKEPFLKGSIAVYKKQTLVGEGTGKLCHIYRPLAIDARQRRCWGELAVVENRLCISVPEKWLGEASYPVVVDPVIGTSTVGSQTHWRDPDSGIFDRLFIEASIAVNRFHLPHDFSGPATAFVYAYHAGHEGRPRPVIYSDSGNTPLARRSAMEGEFDVEVGSGKPAGWRQTTFSANTGIPGGSDIWFGISCLWFHPRFDFGAKCYREPWDHLGNKLPDTYPLWSANWFYDFRLSMYFTYSPAQNYVRVLTQGVNLSDSRRLAVKFKRSTADTAGVTLRISRFQTFFRNLTEYIKVVPDKRESLSVLRKCSDTVQAEGKASRGFLFFIRVATSVLVRDYFLSRFLRARKDIVLKSCISREITLESRIV